MDKNGYFVIKESPLNEEKLKSMIRRGVVVPTASTSGGRIQKEIDEQFKLVGNKWGGLDVDYIVGNGMRYAYHIYIEDPETFADDYKIEIGNVDNMRKTPSRMKEMYTYDRELAAGRLEYFEESDDARNAAEELSKELDCAVSVEELEFVYNSKGFDGTNGMGVESIYYRGNDLI